MKNNNTTKYSIENWIDYIDDEDVEFSIAEVQYFSTKPNSHKHIISEEVLREFAPSIINKWLIAEYNDVKNDVETHTFEQSIIGVFPEQEIVFEYDEDGYLVAKAKAIISKLYATNVYELFKEQNFRSVSVEMLSSFTEDTKDFIDGRRDKIVTEFGITACTVLGLDYQPSVPDSNIKITQFSKEKAEKAFECFVNKDNIQNKILSKLCNIEDMLSKEEVKLENVISKFAIEIGDGLWSQIYNILKEKYVDEDGYSKYWIKGIYEEDGEKFTIVSDDTQLFKIKFIISDDTITMLDELVEVKESFIEQNAENITMFEKIEEETTDEEGVQDGQMQEMKVKCEELEQEVANYKAEIETYKSEIAVLEQFKANVEFSQKQEIIDTTMAKAKELIKDTEFDNTKFDKYITDSAEYSLENIGIWKNTVIAEVAMFAVDNKTVVNETSFDMGIPNIEKKYDSIYK